MIHAELHGKLDPEKSAAAERSEDMLTSEVFGVLKFLPRDLGLMGFLETAGIFKSFPQLKKTVEAEIQETLFRFWPQYPTPNMGIGSYGEEGSTEPDLVIEMPSLLFFIEAKYGSPLGADYTQLAREYIIGRSEAQQGGRKFFLITITKDYHEPSVCPTIVREGRILPQQQNTINIRKGVRIFLKQRNALVKEHQRMIVSDLKEIEKHIFWINWQSLTNHFEILLRNMPTGQPSYLMVEDLCLLLKRKGLRSFQGFSHIAEEQRFLSDIVVGLEALWLSKDLISQHRFEGFESLDGFQLGLPEGKIFFTLTAVFTGFSKLLDSLTR